MAPPGSPGSSAWLPEPVASPYLGAAAPGERRPGAGPVFGARPGWQLPRFPGHGPGAGPRFHPAHPRPAWLRLLGQAGFALRSGLFRSRSWPGWPKGWAWSGPSGWATPWAATPSSPWAWSGRSWYGPWWRVCPSGGQAGPKAWQWLLREVLATPDDHLRFFHPAMIEVIIRLCYGDPNHPSRAELTQRVRAQWAGAGAPSPGALPDALGPGHPGPAGVAPPAWGCGPRCFWCRAAGTGWWLPARSSASTPTCRPGPVGRRYPAAICRCTPWPRSWPPSPGNFWRRGA